MKNSYEEEVKRKEVMDEEKFKMMKTMKKNSHEVKDKKEETRRISEGRVKVEIDFWIDTEVEELKKKTGRGGG